MCAGLGLLFLSSSLATCPLAAALSHGLIGETSRSNRRDALIGVASTAAVAASRLVTPPASAAPAQAETVDLQAFNAARDAGRRRPAEAKTVDLDALNAARFDGGNGSAPRPAPSFFGGPEKKARRTIVPSADPAPLLPIRGGRGGKSTMRIPRVGYSLYKTPPDEAARCVSLALRCGVRHVDVASLYGSNPEASGPLKQYLDGGLVGMKGYYRDEKPELLEFFDATYAEGELHAVKTVGFRSQSVMPPLDGSIGRRARRELMVVSHKLSNEEQSTDVVTVKRRVKAAIAELGVGYLDLVSIHSPLTDKGRRLASYQALLELRDTGFVRSVGVCNYGLGPLREIEGMVGNDVENLPAINQLELSPFNRHEDVVKYCDANSIAVGCSAWSGLSGVDGPAGGWAAVADLAKSRGVTKAQLLVRWSLQKGYVCVPRSGSGSRMERVAIAENSYGGVNPVGDRPFILDDKEMKILDGLDVGYKAGKLGRRDGWGDGDAAGPEWDPTEAV